MTADQIPRIMDARAYIIIMVCLFMIQSTAGENILDKYPLNFEHLHLLSCYKHCGNHTGVCSCDGRCLLYKNCCEDFKIQCPEELSKIDGLKHLRNATIICRHNHLMVATCPKAITVSTVPDYSTSQKGFTYTSNFNSDSTPGLLGNTYIPTTRLNIILRNRPVVDISNGIHFENMDAFRCYQGNESNKRLWDVDLELGRLHPTIHFSTSQEFVQILSSTPFEATFTMPSSVDESMTSDGCYETAVDKCPEAVKEYDPETYERCANFKTYVFARGNNIYYANIYCMQCWEPPGVHFLVKYLNLKSIRTNYGLSILMKMAADGLMSFQIREHGTSIEKEWSHTLCRYDDVMEFRCNDLRCNEDGMILSAEGTHCLHQNTLRLAIGQHGIPLTLNELDGLSSLFSCFIRNYGDEIIGPNRLDSRKPYEFFDQRLNMTIYSFEINILVSSNRQWSQNRNLYESIDTIAKALREYLSNRQDWRPKNERGTRNVVEILEADIGNIFSVHEMTSTDDIHKENERPWYSEKSIFDASTLTTACACMQAPNPKKACLLLCWYSPYFQQDREMIETYLRSQCFAEFSSSFTLHPNLCGLVALYVFISFVL